MLSKSKAGGGGGGGNIALFSQVMSSDLLIF